MKKLIWLLLFLPLISWAQEDSLGFRNQSIYEIMNNRVPSCFEIKTNNLLSRIVLPQLKIIKNLCML